MVLLAGGDGRRAGGGTNKVLRPLGGVPVFVWSLRTAMSLEFVDRLVVVIREEDRLLVEQAMDEHLHEQRTGDSWSSGGLAKRDITLVHGGVTRHGSEWNALQAIADSIDAGDIDVVVIHDAARPLADRALFASVALTAQQQGGALPVREQKALVAREDSRPLVAGNSTLVGVQTPQAFQAGPLLDSYRRADRDGFVGTDTASCVEEYSDAPISCVPCAATNLKLTYPEDFELAERLLARISPGVQLSS